jgi:hypothetical protein
MQEQCIAGGTHQVGSVESNDNGQKDAGQAEARTLSREVHWRERCYGRWSWSYASRQTT